MNLIKKGNYLKELRIRKGLKQTDLADLLHYSFKNISKWENGKSFPTDPSILNKLAEIFEVPVENIIYGQDNAFDIINKKSRSKKLFKRSSKYIVILLFIIILLFLIFNRCDNYYVAKFSNSNISNSKIYVVFRKNHNSFKFNKIDSKKKIKLVSFYYKIDDVEYLLFEFKNEEIIFTEYNDYLEYNFKEVVNKPCYLKVIYFDDTYDIFNLKFR